MIQDMMQLLGVGLLSAVFATVIKKQSGELSVLLSLGACLMIGILFLGFLNPILQFADRLRQLSGLDMELMTPLLKCIGITLLSQIASTVCADAGQGSIGKMIEICASALALYTALPLFEAVLTMIEKLGGRG